MRDIETAVSGKQGRVWAGHQPTLSGVLSQGSDLEPPVPPDVRLGFLLSPDT